jgi:DNA-binding response OmpR family regulator
LAGTIVYVDHEPDLPEGLGRELARLGFRVEYTADPTAALALAREDAARLIIVEPLLDDGAGWALVEDLRRLDPPHGDVPVVVLTRGARTPKLYTRAIELGVDEFLARPVLRSEVIAAVLESIEADRGRRPDDPTTGLGHAATQGGDGRLTDRPVAELLLGLREARATGVLFFQDFEGVEVELRDGAPIAVASSRGDETFADFLMRTKRISGREHEALLERAHAAGESEPVAAVAIGALSRDDARAALAACAAEPLLEAFAWSTGSWRFEPGERIDAGRPLGHAAAAVLAQGVVQWMPARPIRARLDARGALYLSKVEHPPCALDDLAPPPCEAELLDRWIGDATVAQVLDAGEIGERELYALLVAGLVEAREEALLELHKVVADAPAAPEEPPILELDEPCDPLPTGPAPEPRDTAEPAATAVPARGDEEAAVPTRAAKASAPDQTPEEPAGADRAHDDAHHFLEGERHLAAKRYDRAVESFGMAAHLAPDKAEYHAHLGYALHLRSPADEVVRREALEHIAKGVKLGADQWKPLLFLARVFIDAGEDANARKVLSSGVHRHPDCQPLKDELRRLRLRARRPEAGLVGRLRRWWRR